MPIDKPALTSFGPQTAAVGAEVDGIFDLARLAALGDDQGHTVAGLLGMLIANGTSDLDKLGHGWRDDAREAALGCLHAVRGTVGTFGASRLVAVVRELESALRDHASPLRLDALLADARAELMLTLAAAQAWRLRWHSEHALPATVVEGTQLAQLRQLLHGRNLAAIALFGKIELSLTDLIGAQATRDARAAIDRLDFARVLSLIAQAGQGAPTSAPAGDLA